MADRETLTVYDERAVEYAEKFDAGQAGRHLAAFIAALPNGAKVLDIGCGTGEAASHMQNAGLHVEIWDASAEMIRIANDRFGIVGKVAEFADLSAIAEYDGIYANFSLLHEPRADMPAHLRRIGRALKPRGLFHIGLKSGTGEKRDAIGRFYCYYQDAEISRLLEDAGFTVRSRDFGAEEGLDGTVAPWIIIKALNADA